MLENPDCLPSPAKTAKFTFKRAFRKHPPKHHQPPKSARAVSNFSLNTLSPTQHGPKHGQLLAALHAANPPEPGASGGNAGPPFNALDLGAAYCAPTETTDKIKEEDQEQPTVRRAVAIGPGTPGHSIFRLPPPGSNRLEGNLFLVPPAQQERWETASGGMVAVTEALVVSEDVKEEDMSETQLHAPFMYNDREFHFNPQASSFINLPDHTLVKPKAEPDADGYVNFASDVNQPHFTFDQPERQPAPSPQPEAEGSVRSESTYNPRGPFSPWPTQAPPHLGLPKAQREALGLPALQPAFSPFTYSLAARKMKKKANKKNQNDNPAATAFAGNMSITDGAPKTEDTAPTGNTLTGTSNATVAAASAPDRPAVPSTPARSSDLCPR